MSSWKDDRKGIPPWNERPKCYCGFRAWLQVWDDTIPTHKYGCRYFKCPDIDDDFKACTFIQWVDTSPVPRPVSPTQVESKGQYNIRHADAREAARLAREEQERCIRQQ
ncbi:unnamed protein product [Urochloa humidicola]